MVSVVYFALLLLPSSFCSAINISNFGGETYDPPVIASNFVDKFTGSSSIQGLLGNKILDDRMYLNNTSVMPYGRIAHSSYHMGNRVISPRSEIRSIQETAKPEVGHSQAIRFSSPSRSKKSYQADSIKPGGILGGTLIMQLESRKRNSEPLSNALAKLISKLISMNQQNRVTYQPKTPRFERSRQEEVITPRRMYTRRGDILRTHPPYQPNYRFDNNFKTGTRLMPDNQPRSSFAIKINGNMDSAGRERENRQHKTVRYTHSQIRNHSDRKGNSNLNQFQPGLQPSPIKAASTKKAYFSDVLMTPGTGGERNIINELHGRENRLNTGESKSVNKAIVDANKLHFLNSQSVVLGSPRSEPADGPNVQRKGGTKTVSSYTGGYIEIGTPTHTRH